MHCVKLKTLKPLKSNLSVQKNTVIPVSTTTSHVMSQSYSVPSILNGANVHGNVIIHYGNPSVSTEEKENAQPQKKRKWVIYDSSDSD